MVTKDEVLELLRSTETYRMERTTSTGDMDKFQEAICAFSNDLPNSREKGYLILGVRDNGVLSGLRVDDALMKKIASIRSDGNILPLPIPSMSLNLVTDGEKVTKSATKSTETMNEVLAFCTQERSLTEIMAHLGLKHRNNAKSRYVDPLIEGGFLEMTIPEKPNSRNQKYVRALS